MPRKKPADIEAEEIAETAETDAEETAPEEAVFESPQIDPAPAAVEGVVFVCYTGPLPSARVLDVDFPWGKWVAADPNLAIYVNRLHALDACFDYVPNV